MKTYPIDTHEKERDAKPPAIGERDAEAPAGGERGAEPEGPAPGLPDHLAPMPDPRWAFWRWVGLRGAGFPAALPLGLGSAECLEAADRLLDARVRSERALREASFAVRKELEASEGEARPALEKALRRLRKGAPPEGFAASSCAAPPVEEFRAARAQAEAAAVEFARAFGSAVEQVSRAVREIAGSDSFREAVIWQNRHAYHTGLVPLLRGEADAARRGSKQRQREEAVASYLQRYCLKNDTIGFFGPVGWARINPEAEEALTARPGAGLVVARRVFFESWCVKALADALSESQELRPWMAPRLLPTVYLDGRKVISPFRPPATMPERHAHVLRECTGERTARQLAADLVCDWPRLFATEKEVFKILEAVSAAGVVSWKFEVPVALDSERHLRALVERIEDEGLRAAALAPLEEMLEARDAVAAAPDAESLDAALDHLEATFTRLTSLAATRNHGLTYAGRTLVYEDCRRDAEVEIGPELARSLGGPLSLLLTSARWFTVQFASLYRKVFRKIYDDLSARPGSQAVNALSFIAQTDALMKSTGRSYEDALLATLHERWEGILDIPEGRRRVEYTSEELRPRVLEAFDVPAPGWPFARYHSPDVMLAARDIEAVRRGDYLQVLGELHQGINTLGASFFHAQHPAPEELLSAAAHDLPEPRLEKLGSHSDPRTNSRTIIGLFAPKDYLLALDGDAVGPASQVMPVGSLVVEDVDGELYLRARDGRLRQELVEAMGGAMSNISFNSFRLLAPRAHTPRVTIDKLVVARETWRAPAGELAFAGEKDEAARFVAARRWARGRGVPRFVFVKTPAEVKPFYADFASPVYVNILARMVRRTVEQQGADALITVSEMIPAGGETWLHDRAGRHYTSEFRVIAFDLSGRPPAGR